MGCINHAGFWYINYHKLTFQKPGPHFYIYFWHNPCPTGRFMAWGLPHYKSSMAIRNSRLVALSSGNYVWLPKISSHHPNIKHPKIAWSSFFSLEIAYWFHGFMVSFWGCFFSQLWWEKVMPCHAQPKKNKPKPDRHWIVPGARNRSLRSSFSAPNLVFSNGNLPTASNSHGRFPFRFPSRNEQKAPFLKKQL